LAIHELPKSEAAAETVFIRRRDNIASRALLALIAAARPAQAQIAAAE
jgi:hypothetical protein